MANKRIYDEVYGLAANGVNVGGVTQITTEQDYVHKIDSMQDEVDGPSVVSNAGQIVRGQIVTTDILQLIALLIATPTTAVFYGRESGAPTYSQVTLTAPVFPAGSFMSAMGQYSTITAQYRCRFAEETSEFDDVEGFIDAQTAPTMTHPGRIWRPQSCTHGSLSPLHTQGLSFNIPGRLITDYGDADKGETAVDVAGRGLVTGELTIRDNTKQTGPPTHDIATALMKNGVADLACTFEGVDTTTNQVLTIRNVVFRGRRKTGGRDWTGHALQFAVQWRDPTDPYTIRTLDDATSADRLIDFADVV